jgi:hypothetical protein
MRFSRTSPAFRGVAFLSAATFMASALNLALLVRSAQAADAREELAKADDYFQVADFSTALTKVNALLESGDLSGGTLRDAYALKARCEVGLAHRSSAVEAFCEALRVEPGWRPDPDLYTKDELEVFEQARGSCTGEQPTKQPSQEPTKTERPSAMPAPVSAGGGEKPFYKKPLFLGIGAAVVVGGIVALAGGGDDGGGGEPDLPGFPPPPQ